MPSSLGSDCIAEEATATPQLGTGQLAGNSHSGPEQNGSDPSERSLGVCRNKLGCSGMSLRSTPISKEPQVRGAALPAPQAAAYLVTDNTPTGHGGKQKQNTSRVSDACSLRTHLSRAPRADPAPDLGPCGWFGAFSSASD